MTDKNFNPTAQFIAGQLPEFVRVDHPTLVAFLTAYYEWLDSDNTFLRSPKKLANVIDVDTTLEEFISYFKNEYLLDFPEKLAVSETTKKPVDPVKLMKNIKGFYRAKGTEKTYDFLFRILFDTSVEFYYPKNDIMKLSDGKWVVRRSIKVSNNIGNAIFDSVGATVLQRDDNGGIIASGRVIEVSTYRVGTNDIAELFLGGVNGQFVSGYNGIEFTDKTGVLRKENRVFSVIGKLTITNGGSGYKAGDRVVFTPVAGDTGVKAAARVAEVDASGRIRKILIDNYGVNYKVAPTITIESEEGTGFTGSVTISGIAEYQGYYANNDGRLSTNKVIQDNHYYQNFSYVILSEITVDRYRDVLKRLLNPAGLAFFGKVQIKRCAVAELQNSTSLIEYEVPIIGHYAPYTFKTYDDLSNWFTDPNTGLLAGYDPTVHNKIIRNDLDDNGQIDSGDIGSALIMGMSPKEYINSIGNPVTFNRAFQNPLVPLRTANFQNADPFWIVYQHPNRKIRGSVTARIPYDLKNEFLNDSGADREFFEINPNNSGYTGYWAEWTEGSTANRVDWAAGFTSGERYVTLNYNPIKPYTQVYYEPQEPETSNLSTPKSSSKFLPRIYIENVFTYQGLKNIEAITTTNAKSLNSPLDKKNEPTLQTKQASVSNGIVVSDTGQFVSIDETSFSENVPTLSDVDLNKGNDTGTRTLNEKSESPEPIAKLNSYTSWDNMYKSLYKTKVQLVPGGPEVETGHRGINGLTNTSWAAMDKFARSLSGDVALDWNGVSGGAGYRYGDARYFTNDSGLISMNTESWDSLLSRSIGIEDIHDPDSVGNFIINKILVPQFVGGTGADGRQFPGLRDIYPNINFGNYGHPSCIPNYIPIYTRHGGFSANAESSKYEELPVTPETQAIAGGNIGEMYRSYLPSVTCPDCRWDGRTVLDTREPESRKVGSTHIVSLWGGDIASRNHAIKLWKEKWYNYCRNVQVWMPSFYISTNNLQEERSLAYLTVDELVKIRKELRDELGYDDKLIIPYISNKYFTVASGNGGFGTTPPSIQDSSFLTPQEFIDNYIAPCLSGHEKGSVNGFYIWTGDDTYVAKQSLALALKNPRRVEVKDADGNVINWQLEPTTIPYGFDPYWDFCGGEALRGHAPTGPNVIGSNGSPRVAWMVIGGGYGNNPWWGGNRAPSWPTAQASNGSGCQRLEVNSALFHFRQPLLAYQAYLDGMTGQTAAQYVFDKPHKYGYLKDKFPTWFQPGTDLPDWSRLKGYVFHVRKTSADGTHTLPMGMAPGTTFAFNYRNVKFDTGATSPSNPNGTYRPVRQRDGLGITGDIISNPLFNSLTGSSTIFSYPDGRSYKDRGWNTADRIGYVKSVRDLDATTAEVIVEPFFFVGQPTYSSDPRNDTIMWSNIPGYPNGIPSGYPHYGSVLIDGITHGVTSGNGVSNYIAITGPHTRHCCGATDASNPFGPASIVTLGAQTDPNTHNQRPKFINLGFPGDIISFGARGATFELVATSYVTGDFRRSTRAEIDTVFALVDKINQDQIQAAVDYWDNLYNPVRTTDFGFEYDAITESWSAYGPGNRIIINSWKPEQSGTVNCSNCCIKPRISVVTNDADGTMEILYTYTNSCSVEKDIEWPDTPPLNLGDKVEYYDTRVYGATGGIGVFREYDRNYPIYSINYPGVAYSPVHLARTKFEGDCCIDNNFAVSASLMQWRPEVFGNDVSLVVTPPQDYPSVVLAGTQSIVIRDFEIYDKVEPSETTTTSKWASSWSTPTYNNGPTGSTHITTAFRLKGRVSPNPMLDETLSTVGEAKLFLDSVPTERRSIMPFPFNTFAVDDWWRSARGLTLSNTYMTGDACRDSSGNFIEEDINDPRETEGKPYSPAYAGTQRYISPWLDNTTARYKQEWNSWLTAFSATGGYAQYFILDSESSNVCSIWSSYMRKEVSDGTSSKMIRHMNHILNDPRADSLTAGNAPTRGSLKQQLKISSGYTAGQFSNFAAQLTVTGAGPEEGLYKLWNSVMMGMGYYYINEFFSPPIETLYPSARITNWHNSIIQRSDYVSDSNGHRQYFDMDVGNVVSTSLYGELGQVGTNYEIYTPDQKILEYKPGTTKPFGITPWNSFLLDQQKLRAVDRNRLAEGKNKSLQPWIASVKWYGYSGMFAFGGEVPLHDQYWRENVFHTLLHDPELILYWNTNSTTPNDDKYMHDTLNDFNNLTNQRVVGTLSSSNERFVYNTEFLVSGCKTNNKNQNLFRVSVNRSLVDIIDLYGEKYQLGSEEVGIWLLTGANCTAIQKKSYDSLSKTLFIGLNTGISINSRYKAYTDKYGFQFATIAESQLFSTVDPEEPYSSRNSDSRDSTWLSERYNYIRGLSG